MNSQLATEVALLGNTVESANGCYGNHEDDDEEAKAVDEDFQVGLGRYRGGGAVWRRGGGG